MQLHLNSYGLYLHVKDEMFEIKHSEKNQINHVSAHKVKSIWIHKGVAVSSDAVFLALRHNIDIVFLEYDGKPAGRVWHAKLGSTTKIRKAQLQASESETGLDYVKKWVTKKIQNQSDLLLSLAKNRSELKDKLTHSSKGLLDYIEKIACLPTDKKIDISGTLRGYEGNAGKIYFEGKSICLPKNYQFNGRSFRPAQDSYNAFLNYAYGILYSKVEKALILARIDPFVGFLHRDDYNHKSMVYDFIEPYRIYAEIPVFRLFSAKKIRNDHVDQIHNGYTLNSEGKVLLVEKFNQYMEEDKVRYKNRNVQRATIIQLEAHELAQELLKIYTS